MLDASHLLISILATVRGDSTALWSCLLSRAGFPIVYESSLDTANRSHCTQMAHGDYPAKAISGF